MIRYCLLTLLLSLILFAGNAQNKTFANYKEMVAAAKEVIEEIAVEDFHTLYTDGLKSGEPNFVLIDVRTAAEFEAGFIPGSFLIQRGILESGIAKEALWSNYKHSVPKKTDVIVLCCRSGGRSALAAQTLMMLGYINVKSLAGGWKAWHAKYPNLQKEG